MFERLFGKKKDPSDAVFDSIVELKMQSKSLDALARQTEKDMKVAMKRMYYEVKRGNPEGAREFAVTVCQLKQQKNKYIFLACKMEVAATQLRMQAVNAEVMKALSRTTSVLNGMQSMSSDSAIRAFADFNAAMDDQYVQADVMQRLLGPTTVDAGATEDLLKEAQMKVAAENGISEPVVFNKPEAIPDSNMADLTRRLDALMPPL